MNEIILPLNADTVTRKLIGRDGGTFEMPVLVSGDMLKCELRLWDKTTEQTPSVRSLRASLGKVMEPPTGGSFALSEAGDDTITADIAFNANVATVLAALKQLDSLSDLAAVTQLAPGTWAFKCQSNVPEIRLAKNALVPRSFCNVEQTVTHNITRNVDTNEPGDTQSTVMEISGLSVGMPVVSEGFPAGTTITVITPRSVDAFGVPFPPGTPPMGWVTFSESHLVSSSVGVIFGQVPYEQTRTIQLLQTPYAFTVSHSRVLPPAPTVARIREGGSDSGNPDIKINEVQALKVASNFRGSYVLTWSFRQTKILGLEDGPEEIAAALNGMWSDGKVRFTVSNPEPDKAYIEFTGLLGNAPQDLIEVTVQATEPGVLTFKIDLDTDELADALRTVAELKVPFEIELETVPENEDINNPAVPGTPVTLCQHVVTVTRQQIYPALALRQPIDFLRPAEPRDYVAYTPNQIIHGQRHFTGIYGDAVTRLFVVDHLLGTPMIASVMCRENGAEGRELFNGVDYQLSFTDDNSLSIEWLAVTPPGEDGLIVVVTAAGPASAFQAHTHTIAQIVGLQDLLNTYGQRLTAIENLLPTVRPTSEATLSDQPFEIELTEKARVLPGVWPADFDPEAAAKDGTGLRRGRGLLPALHKTSIVEVSALPDGTLATFAFLADYGEASAPGYAQVGAALAGADFVLLGGDNNYPDGAEATINANTATLATLIAAERVWPALGNHDVDTFPPVAMTTRFPYVANGCRYYSESLHELVDLFVLNSGRDSDWTQTEADGISSTSDQHTWFAAQFAASTKPFKLIMFHHPFVAATNASNRIVPEMDWPEFKAQGVIVLNGHTHQSAHIEHTSGLHIVNASFVGQTANTPTQTLFGESAGCTLRFVDVTSRAVLKIEVQRGSLQCRFVRADNGATIHEFEVTAPAAVYKNVGNADIALPGGLGRRSSAAKPQSFFGTDGRAFYRLTRDVVPNVTNSYFPTEFEEELFMFAVGEKMLRAAQRLTVEWELALQTLKADSRAQWLLVVEVGTVPQQAAPNPTGENLENVIWKPAPLLTQRMVISAQSFAPKFGVSIARNELGVFTADVLTYGKWEAAATIPDSANFALRARLVQFDTENSVSNARGFVFYHFRQPKAAIS